MLNELGEGNTFGSNYDCVRIDEAWYFLLADGCAVKVLPNADGTYTVPEAPAVTSKRHIEKVMFIAALARPHPCYPSRRFGEEQAPGKVLMHPVVEEGVYTRGPLAGEVKILNVSITGEVYRRLIKEQVVPAVMENMWWHHRDAGTPEAGKVVWVQQDGASPHTAAQTQRSLQYYSSTAFFNRTGFRLKFVTQPARSPDLNICDLTYWHSNKSRLNGKKWANKQQLINDVQLAWAEYEPTSLEKGWRHLYRVYRGILEDSGGNKYKTHSGDRKLLRQGLPPNVSCPGALVQAGRLEQARLSQELGFAQDSDDGSASDSSQGGSDSGGE